VEDWVSVIDQARAAFGDMAGLLSSYRDKLLAEGFAREEALALVAEAQRCMWQNGQAA
jgi:hypothetical protein